MSSVHVEVAIQSEYGRVGAQFAHADETGIGKRHGRGAIFPHELTHRCGVMFEIKRHADDLPLEQLENGVGISAELRQQKAGFRQDGLVGQHRRAKLLPVAACPVVTGVSSIEESDKRSRIQQDLLSHLP